MWTQYNTRKKLKMYQAGFKAHDDQMDMLRERTSGVLTRLVQSSHTEQRFEGDYCDLPFTSNPILLASLVSLKGRAPEVNFILNK
jgi:hypothetical protein